MLMRIREARLVETDPPYTGPVEADETYVGGERHNTSAKWREGLTRRGAVGETPGAALKDRTANRVASKVVCSTNAETLQRFVTERTEPTATIHTDESTSDCNLPREHEAVKLFTGQRSRESLNERKGVVLVDAETRPRRDIPPIDPQAT